jgi:L-lysine exporter family protein LysE/ArgO
MVAPLAHAFASGFLLCLSACLDLGLVNLAILRTALRDGARPAFLVGLGSCFGDLIYFTLSALGVSALLSWTPVRWTLWLGGAGVLVLLAAKMVREALRPRSLDLALAAHPAADSGVPPPAASALARPLLLGLSLALASPTAILWFAAVGGSVIASFAGQRRILARFVAGFFAAGVLWSLVIAVGGARAGRVGGARLVRIFSLLSAALFAYFAFAVFRAGLRTLW